MLRRANQELVYATGLGVVQGAIVCPDASTASALFEMYSTAWSEQFQNRVTSDQAQLVRGKAMDNPDPADYKCALLAPRHTHDAGSLHLCSACGHGKTARRHFDQGRYLTDM
jgi:hypothetical protein